jgi:hypothetical protein
MSEIINRKSLEDFYENMSYRSPVLLFLMMVLSSGSYIILWIYNLNKRFEDFDLYNSPNSGRGLVIMFLFPLMWILSMFILKILNFINLNILWYVDIIGWSFIVFLALAYIYDFCVCFGKFTMTNGFIWYMFLWVGFFPLLLLPFGIFYFLPILFFPAVTIPIMQSRLNHEIERFERGVSGSKFYVRVGKNN